VFQPVDPFHLFNVLAFRAVTVPAGVIGMLPVAALVAFILVPSECRSPATDQIREYFFLPGT
jgi:hypothetical protein